MKWYQKHGLLLKVGDTEYRSGLPFVDVLYSGEVRWTEVKPEEESRLDLIAWRTLDDFDRWRDIAYLNNIRDWLTEVTIGRSLAYPLSPIPDSSIIAWTYRE